MSAAGSSRPPTPDTRHPTPEPATSSLQRLDKSGTFYTLDGEWHPGDTVTLDLPLHLRVERRHRGAASLLRGPLVFALRIGEEWRRLKGDPPHADWEISPTTPWNYALALDPAHPEAAVTIHDRPISPLPFDPIRTPVVLTARARPLPDWTLQDNSAGPTPESPARIDQPLETVELIPYGSTHLRVAEFPLVEE